MAIPIWPWHSDEEDLLIAAKVTISLVCISLAMGSFSEHSQMHFEVGKNRFGNGSDAGPVSGVGCGNVLK